MSPLDLIALASDAASKQSIATTLTDAGLLYEDYEAFKAGTLKLSTMPRPKVLALAASLKRETALLEALLADPTEYDRIINIAKEKGL